MPLNPGASLDAAVVADLLSRTPEPEREEFMLAVIATYVRRRPDLSDEEVTKSVIGFVTEVRRRAGLAA